MNNYPPTAEELRKYLHKHGVNGHEAAAMLHVSRRAVGYWMSGFNARNEPINIPYTCWYTLRTKVEGKLL